MMTKIRKTMKKTKQMEIKQAKILPKTTQTKIKFSKLKEPERLLKNKEFNKKKKKNRNKKIPINDVQFFV